MEKIKVFHEVSFLNIPHDVKFKIYAHDNQVEIISDIHNQTLLHVSWFIDYDLCDVMSVMCKSPGYIRKWIISTEGAETPTKGQTERETWN